MKPFPFIPKIVSTLDQSPALPCEKQGSKNKTKSSWLKNSPLFLCFFLLEFRSLALYVPPVLFCVLLSLLAILSILLFFSTLLSIPCFVYSFSVYSLYFLISLIVSFSNLLSLLFSFLYSICSTLMCYYYWICSLSLVKTGINFKKT